jgi:hypothetical protein
MTHRVKRSANGRTWDVVDANGKIVEGGFFAKHAAVESCDGWNDPVLDAEAAEAAAWESEQRALRKAEDANEFIAYR